MDVAVVAIGGLVFWMLGHPPAKYGLGLRSALLSPPWRPFLAEGIFQRAARLDLITVSFSMSRLRAVFSWVGLGLAAGTIAELDEAGRRPDIAIGIGNRIDLGQTSGASCGATDSRRASIEPLELVAERISATFWPGGNAIASAVAADEGSRRLGFFMAWITAVGRCAASLAGRLGPFRPGQRSLDSSRICHKILRPRSNPWG